MPDESFIQDRRQQSALDQLEQRLRLEQVAFDPGDQQYDDYQTRLDAIMAKNAELAQARLLARSSPPGRA